MIFSLGCISIPQTLPYLRIFAKQQHISFTVRMNDVDCAKNPPWLMVTTLQTMPVMRWAGSCQLWRALVCPSSIPAKSSRLHSLDKDILTCNIMGLIMGPGMFFCSILSVRFIAWLTAIRIINQSLSINMLKYISGKIEHQDQISYISRNELWKYSCRY